MTSKFNPFQTLQTLRTLVSQPPGWSETGAKENTMNHDQAEEIIDTLKHIEDTLQHLLSIALNNQN